MYLQVEHRQRDFKKTWKLESGTKPFSIGHSRQADIRLDKSHPGILGVIQFQQGQWTFTHLHKPEPSPQHRFIPINGPTIIPLKEGELRVSPFDRQIRLLNETNENSAKSGDSTWVWLIWKRNDKIWYSEFCKADQPITWPHNQKPVTFRPSVDWQYLADEGISLSYKLTSSPETKGLFDGAFKGIFDPSLRPYLVGATVACLLTGLLSMMGKKADDTLAMNNRPSTTSSTVITLERKPVPPQPKNAVAKALAQTTAPKTQSAPKASAHKALGLVFSQIGKRSLKNIAMNSGAKTLTITSTVNPVAAPTSAKTFKVLGSLGSGTGLQPSQFTKGLGKDGGVGLGGGTVGATNLGQISQGNVGQGDLGLMHKESQVSGGLDRDVIAKYIQGQKGKILYCYERQLSANPGLFGKVSVKFQIAPGGEVETSNVTESTLGSTSVESCLLQLIGQWRFPKPEGGVRVLVTYPFVFKSLN
jgi:TonB family protein